MNPPPHIFRGTRSPSAATEFSSQACITQKRIISVVILHISAALQLRCSSLYVLSATAIVLRRSLHRRHIMGRSDLQCKA